jgi:proteic killer suppression protein
MEVRFKDRSLDRLETDEGFDGGYPQAVVRAYRNRMQFIRNAPDERDFYAMRSFRFEKLKGARKHQHSMRLNDQFRLILEFETSRTGKTVVVISIEDYH